jgi:methyltransferase
MSVLDGALLFVLLQRAAELVLARRNTRWLRVLGAVELDARVYPLFVVLHAGWLATMAALIPPDTPPAWPILAGYGVLQLARVWVIASLGRRWTTRLLVLPNAEPVSSGPYRWCRHPNYAIVTAEIALLPLAFGAVWLAIACSAANALLLVRRIGLEDAFWKHPARRRQIDRLF